MSFHWSDFDGYGEKIESNTTEFSPFVVDHSDSTEIQNGIESARVFPCSATCFEYIRHLANESSVDTIFLLRQLDIVDLFVQRWYISWLYESQ